MSVKNKVGVLLLCMLVMPVYAEKADRDKPMNIEAQNATLDQKTQVSVFTGNVVVVQGTMHLQANKVTVHEDNDGNQYSEGAGTPVKFRQKMDNSPDYLYAEALRYTYDGKTGILTLYDKAWVQRGTDEVRGDVVIYNTHEETYEARTKEQGRVNVVITPKKKTSPASAPAAKTDKAGPGAESVNKTDEALNGVRQ